MSKIDRYGKFPQTGPDGSLKCGCGRQQALAPSGVSGGVTTLEAELLGWRLMAGKGDTEPYWLCPFCTGNLGNLKKVLGE